MFPSHDPGATNISQTDNRRLYRADGARPVINPTSGGGGLDVEWRSPVTIAASETIQTNLTSILADTDELQQNQGDWLTATGFSTFDPASDQVIVGTNNDKTNYSLTTADKDDIVDRNWDEPYNQHTTAGSFGKLMDILRKANRAIEGQVTGTPTTTSFTSNITGYVTGAFDSEILVFVSGTMNGEARPILDYSSTNGTFNFEEAWTQAPSSSDEFVILPYHVHPISEIQEGLSTQASVDTIDSNVDDIKAKTDQLNFTGSDVQSVASNMRGTDGANTVAPDNAGIAANGSAIAALNDISSADVKTQADQALVDYDADTKSHVKPSISI